MTALSLTIDHGIADLTFDLDGQKVNKLTTAVMTELERLLDDLKQRTNVQALTIRSAKPGIFIAGADIGEIAAIADAAEGTAKASLGQRVLSKLSALPFPTVAVIDGACLGGGLELALACTYRVASDAPQTSLGLPEVTLGIIPGFGGTQRLPRLVGLRQALKLILSGKPIDAKKAWRTHLVDECCPQALLNDRLHAFVDEVVSGRAPSRIDRARHPSRLRELVVEDNPLAAAVIFRAAAHDIMRRTHGLYPAPLKALEVVRRSYTKSLPEGLDLEAHTFGELVVTDICKNLVGLFYAREHLRKGVIVPGTSGPTIDHAAVVGAGAMGGGIAWALTHAGITTRLKDLDWDAIARGFAAAAEINQQLKRLGKLDDRTSGLHMHRLTGGTDYRGFKHADIVIEAVVEDLDVKRQVFAEIEAHCRTSAVIASNTSTLSIADMAAGMARPERFVGMHFFNPVNRMPLIEVVRGPATSDEAVEAVVSLAKKMKKTPVVVQDCPGFLVNRLLLPYLNEALRTVEEGAAPDVVDRELTNYGMPMGPLALVDQVGLDICHKASVVLAGAYGDRMAVSGLLGFLYHEHGLYGRKGDAGFYVYDRRRPRLNPALKGLLAEYRRQRGVDTSQRLRRQTIMERTLLAMINEAARALDEGVVSDAEHLDMALILGTGFPPFRGGLLRYADSLGVGAIVPRLRALAVAHGRRFTPCAPLIEMMHDGQAFYPAEAAAETGA
jgi:3-hydroxyacyl-CoA dehydrogenase/enoyl-CoA hydratase/3-hydroxybutyryl-CoA epimerase